jgi:ligand-binding sensor domain-containing protein
MATHAEPEVYQREKVKQTMKRLHHILLVCFMLGSLEGTSYSADNTAATRAASSFVYAQAVDRNGTLYFATGTQGVFIVTENQIRAINNGLLTRSVYSLQCDDQGTLYAGTDNGVFRTTDKGASWNVLGTGLEDIAIIGLAGGTRGSLLAVSVEQQLFRFDANDRTWHRVLLEGSAVTTIAKDLEGSIFVSRDNGAVYRSNDEGAHWQLVGTATNAEDIVCLAINGERVVGGTRGGGVIELHEGVWQQLGYGLKSGVIHTLASDGISLYAGTDDGVYVLSHEKQWVTFSDELARIPVLSLIVREHDRVYAGTSGFGLRPVRHSSSARMHSEK